MDLSNCKILIVDDEANNIRVLADCFKDEVKLSYATNGKKALELAKSIQPDLILLDIMMPEMDGYQVCQQLKLDDLTKAIPVVFATAMNQMEDEQKGLDLGAIDYITKPYRLSIIKRRVFNHLQLKMVRDQFQRSNQENQELVHILCHDLCNPLFAIDMMIELLGSVPEKKAIELRSKMKDASRNGLAIIEMVRELKVLDEKKNSLVLKKVNLAQAIDKSISMLSHRFEEKDVKLLADVDSDLDVKAEEVSLVNSVLNNILTNALKFSYKNSKVIIKAKKVDSKVLLTIQDFGMGIPKNIQKDLFNLAKLTSRLGTDRERGTGFGMPSIKKFIVAYGANIDIWSQDEYEFPDDHGTTLKICFQSE
ncbi:hybrid sensor histidine kinase/response regulator [bacterium]|nr:hybrid sensor histidine kinase/response regulator [bacterium]